MSNATLHPRTAPPKTARDLGIMRGFPPPPEKRPTLENWDLPPFNRWSFQNVRSLIPTVDVFRGTGPVTPLPEAPAPLDGLRFALESGEELSLERFLDLSYTDGFIALHKGRVIHERYLNGMTPAALHLGQSVSKSILGLLAGCLHGDGLLDLDAPLADLVPDLAQCGYGDATLDQVLDMRSGVRFTEDYNAADSDMTRLDVASGWRPAPGSGPRPTISDVILSLGSERPHGGAFSYRSVETDAAAWVLERLAGQPLAQLIGERLWQPIGPERDAFYTVDEAGTAQADGGFNATLRDYARLGLLVQNAGRAGGRQVVPAAWFDQMRSGDGAAFGKPYTHVTPNGAYRRFWWIRDRDRGDLCARGVFGQLIYVDPEAEFVAVKLSTWPDYLMPQMTRDTFRALDAIKREIGA